MAQVSDDDRARWDERYVSRESAAVDSMGPPPVFAAFEHSFPIEGPPARVGLRSRGVHASGWRSGGWTVCGVDVSATAVEQARDLAARSGVGERCRFDVVDLDAGLPDGPVVDVLVCHRFRDRRLDEDILDRLAPGGVLAISALSEVGARPGRFRVVPGELTTAFAGLYVIAAGEGDGEAWLLGRNG